MYNLARIFYLLEYSMNFYGFMYIMIRSLLLFHNREMHHVLLLATYQYMLKETADEIVDVVFSKYLSWRLHSVQVPLHVTFALPVPANTPKQNSAT